MSGLSFEVWVECLHLHVSSVNCMNDVYELYFDVCVGFFVGNISIYLQPLVQNMKTQKEALHDTDGKKSVSATEAQDFLLHCLSGSCCLILTVRFNHNSEIAFLWPISAMLSYHTVTCL